MQAETRTALADGAGRGFTVLCTIPDAALLSALADIAGSTGLVLAASPEPPAGSGWHAIRCQPASAIPVRSHVVDTAVIAADGRLEELAGEVRRALAPGGDLRVLLGGSDPDTVAAALDHADISPLETKGGVLIGRGP
jgi:hypothetical protein